jgi:hypothetical protein
MSYTAFAVGNRSNRKLVVPVDEAVIWTDTLCHEDVTGTVVTPSLNTTLNADGKDETPLIQKDAVYTVPETTETV